MTPEAETEIRETAKALHTDGNLRTDEALLGLVDELRAEVADYRRRLLTEGDADIAEAEVKRLTEALATEQGNRISAEATMDSQRITIRKLEALLHLMTTACARNDEENGIGA